MNKKNTEGQKTKGMLGKVMGGFGIGTIVIVILAVVLLLIGGFASNETENWTIVQHPVDFGLGDTDVGDGKIIVEDEKNPWIPKFFGTTKTYPDNVTEFFSDKDDEGGEDGDTTTDKSVKVVFKDKGTASFSAQVVYETPIALADQVEFHKLAKGKMEVASKTVQTALNQACRFVASGMTASEFIEKQEQVVLDINEQMKNNKLVSAKWHIEIVDVQISDIKPDDMTLQLFAKQQEALLNAKTAEAKESEFKMKKLETEADYEQQIAQAKGEADMVAMTATTDARREAELATIEAQRKVDVQELQKLEAQALSDKMEIDANALFLVAEIDAEAKLKVAEIAKLSAIEQASAIVALAEAEEEKIRLAGAMTEQERVRLEIQKEQNIGVADAWANGNRLTPDFIIGGGGEGGNVGDINSTLFSMKLMESMGMLESTNGVAKVTR